jgi:nucleotide sugar dehydrogenase
VKSAEHVVVIVGTPVDDHLNPDLRVVPRAVEAIAPHLIPGQLLILRSTVHPGVTALTEKALAQVGLVIDVAFCPERIAEGRAMTELFDLPQIIAGRTEHASDRATKLFSHLSGQTIRVSPEEAELAKLFTNTWRYIKFATANQFWMMANDAGLDFSPIRMAITHDYPRAADLPMPGFAAGPCLRLGHAKVDHLGNRPAVVVRDQDIRRLNVAVDYPLLMGMLDRLTDLHEKLQPLAQRQPVLITVLRDRHAVNELHHEVGQPGRGRASV